MSNLGDLLALLPDNDTGAIDADDLRAIVSALHADAAAAQGSADGNATQIADHEARITALEAGP